MIMMISKRLFKCSVLFTVLFLMVQVPLYAVESTQQDNINFVEIIESAEFANAAYLTEAEIAGLLASKNYQLTFYQTLPDINMAYFIATNELTKNQIVAIRGTSNIENTILDISVKLTVDPLTGIRLHDGFSLAAKKLYTSLKQWVKKDYQINTTGHSLGGAVALIVGMYLDVESFNINQIITFGQPKVTNVSGARSFNHLAVTRVVTALDLVPLMPPFDPLDINNLDLYWHTGKELLLLDDTRYSELEGLNSMLRATRFTQQLLDEKNLINHKMSVYLDKLNDKKESSERVPYQNSFNLFNLFGN